MDKNNVTATPWLILKDAIQKILIDNKSCTNYNIMKLYRYSFKIISNKQSENLYDEVKNLITEHLENNVRESLIKILGDSDMLYIFCNFWDDFQLSIDSINRILIYLDRVYVKNNLRIQNISTMSSKLFSILVIYYGRILENVRAQMIQMISEERDGKTVDRETIKKILTIMMSLKTVLDIPTSVNEIPTMYDIEFRPTVLDNFSSFFYAEGEKIIKTSANAMTYINSAESLIAREKVRIKYYFDEKTQIQLESIININLVQLHVDAIVKMKNNDIKYMIENNEYKNLTHMYDFLNRVDNGLKPMMKYLNMYVCEMGKLVVQDTIKNGTGVIQGLIDLRNTCNNLLVKCYYNDMRLKATFTDSFDYVVGSNPEMAKYLSIFVIDKLKIILRSVETTNQEKVILEAMKMYDSLKEKDRFEYKCKQFIAMVLLNRFLKCSGLNNTEMRLLSILKANCSDQFTSRVNDMITDVDTYSKTIMDKFKQHIVQSKNHRLTYVDHFNAFVLNKAYWPAFENIKCNLPLELSTVYDYFKKFYKTQKNRDLTLLPNYGLVDLKAIFYGSTESADKSPASVSPNKYTIEVSTLQACVLLLFNNCDQLTFETILKETNIPEHYLIPVLQSLILKKPSQCNILMKNPQYQKIKLTDKFYINEAFTSESNTVKIHYKKAKFKKVLERETNEGNMDQNHMLIELSIARIMKLKKKMTHAALIEEVVSVNSELKPTTAIIKRQINKLIEREYIERSTEDPHMYLYIA